MYSRENDFSNNIYFSRKFLDTNMTTITFKIKEKVNNKTEEKKIEKKLEDRKEILQERVLKTEEVEKIVNEIVQEIKEERKITDCPELVFNLENYLTIDENEKNPIFSPEAAGNVETIHNHMLVPIAEYYKEKLELDGCILIINRGILSNRSVKEDQFFLIKNRVSLHFLGKAVDFRLKGVNPAVIFYDLINQKLPIKMPYGVCSLVRDGIHITMPYLFGNQTIQGFNLDYLSEKSLKYQWL